MVENRFKSTEKWMKWENVKNESIVIYINSCMKKGFFFPSHCAGIYTLSVWNKWFLQSVSSNTSAGALCDLSSLISLYRPDHRFHWTSKEELDDFKFFFLTVAFFFSFFFFSPCSNTARTSKKVAQSALFLRDNCGLRASRTQLTQRVSNQRDEEHDDVSHDEDPLVLLGVQVLSPDVSQKFVVLVRGGVRACLRAVGHMCGGWTLLAVHVSSDAGHPRLTRPPWHPPSAVWPQVGCFLPRTLAGVTLIPPLRHLSGAAPTARMTVPSEERRAAAAIHPQQRQGREKKNWGGGFLYRGKSLSEREELQRRKLTGPGSVFSLNSLLTVVIFWY